MKYSREPRFRKYVKGSGFLYFARKFGDKCSKKLMDSNKNSNRRSKDCFKKSSSKNCRSYERFDWK